LRASKLSLIFSEHFYGVVSTDCQTIIQKPSECVAFCAPMTPANKIPPDAPLEVDQSEDERLDGNRQDRCGPHISEEGLESPDQNSGEEIIERPGEVLTETTLSLGDARAELVLIARGYQQAAERQAPLRALIAETASLPGIQVLVAEVEMELAQRLGRWLARKPATQNMDAAEQCALFIQIIGGWVFWMSKQGTSAFPPELDSQRMLDLWADRWATVLDKAP
jgi:hypothetical protein